MQLIRHHPAERPAPEENVISLITERANLSKRRWRGVAADGREFGFDLDHGLSHGDAIFRDECGCYAVFQAPEPILEIAVPASRIGELAWQIGNLHFPLEIQQGTLRTIDDAAVRQMLDREGVDYVATRSVFRPLSAAVHGHHHH